MTVAVLLTGASGYVGQHLLQSFLNDCKPADFDVTAVCFSRATELEEALGAALNDGSDASEQQRTTHRLQIQVQNLDFSDDSQVSSFLATRKFDVCIHTAAISTPRTCKSNPGAARAVNVPKTFLTTLSASGCRIIAFSTDQVYGGNEPPYKESDVTDPLNVYAETKVNLEALLISGAETGDVIPCHVLLRSSIILGPLAPFLPAVTHDTFLHFCASRRDQSTVFYVDERRSAVAVADVASVVLWLIRNREVQGVYNLGGPHGVSRFDIAKAVFSHLGFKSDCLVQGEKASEAIADGSVATPLDITMDVTKLASLTGLRFAPIDGIVKATFP